MKNNCYLAMTSLPFSSLMRGGTSYPLRVGFSLRSERDIAPRFKALLKTACDLGGNSYE